MAMAVLLASVSLTGCLGEQGPDPPTRAPGSTDGRELSQTISFSGCHQQHLAFSGRVADLQPLVPEGFTLIGEDPAGETTTLSFVVSACQAGTLPDGQEMAAPVLDVVLELHVQPPEALDDEHDDVLIIERYTADPHLATVLSSWGLAGALEESEIVVDQTLTPAAASSHTEVPVPDGTYTLDTTIEASGRSFDASTLRVWFTDGQAALTGSALRTSQASSTIGAGSVAFTYDGSAGGPPVTGGLAHEVTGLAWNLTSTPEVLA